MACGALTQAHTLGLIHRDIKPANIMLCTQGGERDVVKVLDFYSLGAVAYYLLCGVDVFDGKSLVEVCSQHLHQQPQAPSARGVSLSAELEALVLACLDKDPSRRPQSAAELRRQLEACSVREPWDSQRALDWWRTRAPDLESAVAASTEQSWTIAVDAAQR